MHIILLRLHLLVINVLGWIALKPINSHIFFLNNNNNKIQEKATNWCWKMVFQSQLNSVRYLLKQKEIVANLSVLFSYFSFEARTAWQFTFVKCSVTDAGRRRFWIWFIVRLRMSFCLPERKKGLFYSL